MEWWNECSGEIIFAGRFLKNSLKYSNIYGPALTNYRLPRYAKIIWLLHRFSFFTDSLKYESSLLRVYACVTRELFCYAERDRLRPPSSDFVDQGDYSEINRFTSTAFPEPVLK